MASCGPETSEGSGHLPHVIMMGPTRERVEVGKEGSGKLPVALDVLRCFHPRGAIWMVRDEEERDKGRG